MIDPGRHMWDHYLPCFFILLSVYYIYEIIIVYEWQEEYEARLSQARFDATLSVGESQLTPLDPAEEQRLRTQCWVVAAGPKHKGRLYSTWDLAHAYKYGDENII